MSSILIVDDNPYNRSLVAKVAQREGYDAVEADNGRQALEYLQENRFNLVVLDLLMPGMDGFETAGRIREMGFTLPIIAVSALSSKQDRQNSIRAGCDDYFPKPMTAAMVRKILATYGARDSHRIVPAGNTAPRPAHPARGLDLILVEGDEILRTQYRRYFTSDGFTVREFSSGDDALACLQQGGKQNQIIVSNVFTPGIDGLGLLSNVKRDFSNIPVFLYTRTYDSALFQYAIQQKVDGIIPQDQVNTSAAEMISSAIASLTAKEGKKFEKDASELIRKAQDRLMLAGCDRFCHRFDAAYQPLHEAGGDMIRGKRCEKNGHCIFVLTDVAGHDVTSSYTSAMFTGFLLSFWDDFQDDPLGLLKKVNKELLKTGNDHSHICATVVLWDRWTGRITTALAGNPGGMVVRSGPDGRPEFTRLKGGGMVLGALDIADLFISECVRIEPESLVFFFSDGIEAQDLMDVVNDRALLFNSQESIHGICQYIIDHILGKKEQEDDLSLFCFYSGKQRNHPGLCAEFFSTYEEVDRACVWLDEQTPAKRIPSGVDRDLLLLAAREAFLNAVEHGNKRREKAMFEVCIDFDPGSITLDVADEGEGFDLEKCMCPKEALTLTQISNRGLTMITAVAHQVKVTPGAISMVFQGKK